MLVEMLFGDVFQRQKIIDARVVHQNVEFAVGFLGFREQPCNVRLFRDIALYRNSLASLCGDSLYHPVSTLFAGRVIHDHRCALRRERLRDSCSDAFGCSGDHCNLIRKLTHKILRYSMKLPLIRYFDDHPNDAQKSKRLCAFRETTGRRRAQPSANRFGPAPCIGSKPHT